VDAVGQIIDLARVDVPLDVPALFGAALPLEIELGAGKGRFLLEWGAAHPEVALIGVERARTYLEMAARRAARAGLANVRLLHTTAEDLLFRCLTTESVTAVHVYFPDPWPKSRHHKRRFFRPDNVARLADVLVPGGVLRVKTDHNGYAAVIAQALAAERRLQPVAAAAAFEAVPASNFEVKYAREGRLVHRFAFLRA
jgi:tRNA (guanine-N7-)-methyltransferase